MIKSPTPCLREEGVTGGLATPGMKVSLRTPILSFMGKKTATSFPRLRQEDEIFLQDQDSVRTMRRTFPQAPTLPAAAPVSTSTWPKIPIWSWWESCWTNGRTETQSTPSRRIEHCSVVVVYEDGTEVHVGHFCPEPDDSGKYTGKNLAESLHNFCLKRKVPTSDIKFIGTDGTLKMTGHKTGAQAEFEKILCRPLQRMGCMFHNLELVSQIIYNQVRDWMLNISNECSTLLLRSSPSRDVPISILGVVWPGLAGISSEYL